MSNEEFYTVEDVSGILKLKKHTVYEIIKRGELSCTKLGKQIRILKSDFDAYCKSRRKNADSAAHFDTPQEPISLADGGMKSLSQSGAVIIAGQDFCLDLLLAHIPHPQSSALFRSFLGGYNGLYELYHQRLTMTAVHLWDAETGSYNLPYVRRMLPGVSFGVIRLAGREQGFYVQKGNPKKIREWRDLSRGDITVINREKGSGTRILMDQKLTALGIDTARIPGYRRESTSNLACANIVARGGADVACGSQRVAESIQTVEFIPLQKEWYDLVYRKDDKHLPAVKKIIEIATSDSFRHDLALAGGYDISQTGIIL